jgi:hypothetical protein
MVNFLCGYFEPEPIQWGLRGDPPLWRDMKQKTVDTIAPSTICELDKLLNDLFKELTGENPQKGRNIYVKKYDQGGMSRGIVSSDFWLDRGFPLIMQRCFEKI